MATENYALIRTVGIIGAGAMGRGIAEVCAATGLHVRLLDECRQVASTAVQRIKSADANALVRVASCESDLSDADLVIEAVPEELAIKTSVLARIEPHLSDHAIVASNSSSLSITQLSTSLRLPARFCGLHFCHPVEQRPLVEVVQTESTDAKTMALADSFAKSIGMSPVIVKDSPGFLLNRLLVPYMNETLELLLHGASIESLDRAAKTFGMPIRPLALFDEFGIDVALAVGRSLFVAFPERIAPSELLIAMYKSGRRGRKAGDGFYHTPEDATFGRLDPDVQALIGSRRRSEGRLDADTVALRLFLPTLLEATRMLEEQLVDDSQTIDRVLRDGLGLQPPYRGLFPWANAIGAAPLLERLKPLRTLGEHFAPTSLLRAAADHHLPIGTRRPMAG
ncbi:MAG: NAD(P)-binding domain-containing protein [Planctomycetaceae bacterium]|nr:NAD(P)-binding domain-containing protein [Planctomycetaceae bacterium]